MPDSDRITLDTLAATVGSQGAQISAIAELIRDLKNDVHTISQRIGQPSDLSRRTAESLDDIRREHSQPRDWKGIVGLQLTGLLVAFAIGGAIASSFNDRLERAEELSRDSRSLLYDEIELLNARELDQAYARGTRDARISTIENELRRLRRTVIP